MVGHPYEQGRHSNFSFLFSALHFLFIFFLFYFLSFYFYFILFLTAINLWCLCLWEKIAISFWQVFWYSSLGNALDFALFGSSSHYNVFLATLLTMCHLSLGVWTNILFVLLFVLFSCFVFFLFVYSRFCLYIKKIFLLFIAMLLIGHNLHHNCRLHIIGVFNVFEHCLSLEIPVFDSYVGLERLYLFDWCFTCTLPLGSVRYEIWLWSVFLEILRFLRCDDKNLGCL